MPTNPLNSWLENHEVVPTISVVIPVLNEVNYLQTCLTSILEQDYPRNKLDILFVDGESDDGSADLIRREIDINPDIAIRLLSNPRKKTPRSLNIGIQASTGEVVVILGAHTEIMPGFFQKNIQHLRQPGVFCSGGTQINVGQTATQASIGLAMSHWFGFPTAPYRYRKTSGYVNTVVYGAYRREVFDEVGYFEEAGRISEDSEFNYRLIKAGMKIYFDPSISTRYYPRSTLPQFARQLFNYGILRSQSWKKQRQGTSWFHLMAPAVLLLLTGFAIFSPWSSLARIIVIGFLLIYGLTALGFSLSLTQKSNSGNPVLVFFAFIIMHVGWASGFLAGLLFHSTRNAN